MPFLFVVLLFPSEEMMKKKYDVVLYGASGFTGRQSVDYFCQNAPTQLSWAIAGRNESKLLQIKNEVVRGRKNIDVLVADGDDMEHIQGLVKSTRVVLTTAGPFSLYGKNIIKACAELGVDYVDITGETAFVRDVMETHEEIANRSGAKIIPFSGFDSVPSDLAVFIISEYLREKNHTKLDSVKGIFSIKGSFNGGTLLSMLHMFESGDWERMKDPTLLIREKPRGIKTIKDTFEAKLDKTLNRWITPFLMSMINTRVVNRSAHLSNVYGLEYGPNFSYTEHHNFSDWWNPTPAYLYTAAFRSFQTLGTIGPFRELIRRLGPSASEGPSEKEMDEGSFRLDAIGTGTNQEKVHLEISCKGDPGNRATTIFLCESALALATNRKELPGGESRCGFLTPAIGLGNVLIERLKRRNIIFKIHELDKR